MFILPLQACAAAVEELGSALAGYAGPAGSAGGDGDGAGPP